ncbi:MAG: MarR family transcriptional regulator [Dehalococcoidia bacterium]|nr:MarR family transcriptional regulator [Dehalococcoidia bacterium]MDD5494037.1 MarR family transcriptional regulator [Dehalococcoidia bacterium]
MQKQKQSYQAEQIIQVVHIFVRLWGRFEKMLNKELAITRGESAIRINPNLNYSLFYRVGNCMRNQETLTMGELSEALSVSLSAATRITNWLVEDGYLQRLADPEDRRIVLVTLTEKGRALYRAIDKFTVDHVRQILSSLTEDERAETFQLIYKITSALKEKAA